MTSNEDQQSTVIALYNQMYALYDRLLSCIGPTSPEGQAEQSRMTEFSGIVARLTSPQEKINKYTLKLEYLNNRIAQTFLKSLNGNCRVSWRIGPGGGNDNDGSGSGGCGRESAAARFVAANGTMHGQSNAMNSPASVQSTDSSQPVQRQQATRPCKQKIFRCPPSISQVSNLPTEHSIFNSTSRRAVGAITTEKKKSFERGI